jgi:hypothetical protein
MAVEITIANEAIRSAVEAALYDYTQHQIGETGIFDDLGEATRVRALCGDVRDIPRAVWDVYDRLGRLQRWIYEVRTTAVGSTIWLDVNESHLSAALEFTRSHIEEGDAFWDAAPERRKQMVALRDACVELEGALDGPLEPEAAAA